MFRVVADEVTAALARCEDVETTALIGSVARQGHAAARATELPLLVDDGA